jgi:hypothetical protein
LAPSREVTSLTGPDLRFSKIIKYYKIVSFKRHHLVREVTSLEGDNFVVFHYLGAYEMLSDKRDCL